MPIMTPPAATSDSLRRMADTVERNPTGLPLVETEISWFLRQAADEIERLRTAAHQLIRLLQADTGRWDDESPTDVLDRWSGDVAGQQP